MDENIPRTAFVMVADAPWLDAHGAQPRRNEDYKRSFGVLRQVLWLLCAGHYLYLKGYS